MSIVLTEIWLCLTVAAILGMATGWLLWGKPNRRLRAVYRRRLARLQGNWEAVEEELAKSLARVAELERAASERTDGDGRGSPSEPDPRETREPVSNEADLLTAAVRGLEERILCLEAGVLTHEGANDAISSEPLLTGKGNETHRRRGGTAFSHSALPGESVHSVRRRVAKRKDPAPVK
jgi:hypothetical protein